MTPIQIVHVGLGPIGRQIVDLVAKRPDLQSVAGMDIDPRLAGKTLLDLVPGAAPVPVVSNASDLPQADVAILATTSRLSALVPQVESLLARGLNVVSTCEELVWPHEQPALACQIDRCAREAGKVVLGVGINPGFIMDLPPVVFSAILPQVERVRIVRRLNVGKRRAQLQSKNGVGRPVEEVQPLVESNELGHVGLGTSANLVAAALGWKLTKVKQVNSVVSSDKILSSAFGPVPAGRTVGIRQLLTAYEGAKVRIEMELLMTLEDIEEIDEVRLYTGKADEELVVATTGVRGDTATAAIAVNAVKTVLNSVPGLRTILDVPPIRAF